MALQIMGLYTRREGGRNGGGATYRAMQNEEPAEEGSREDLEEGNERKKRKKAGDGRREVDVSSKRATDRTEERNRGKGDPTGEFTGVYTLIEGGRNEKLVGPRRPPTSGKWFGKKKRRLGREIGSNLFHACSVGEKGGGQRRKKQIL